MKKQKVKQILFGCGLLSTLIISGCQNIYGDAGVIHDRRQEYLASSNGKKLAIPRGIEADRLSNNYLIPDTAKDLTIASNYTPPGSLIAKGTPKDGIVTQPALSNEQIQAIKLAEGKGLLIKQPYQQAWLSVSTALRRQRLPTVEMSKDKHFFKIADTFKQEAGVSQSWDLYYVFVTPKGDTETLVQLKPIGKKQRFNKVIEKRLLARVEDGIKGKYKPKSLLTVFKQYV